MAALRKYLLVPPGSIHVTQEIESLRPVPVGTGITCTAKVSRKQDRGNLHLLTVDLGVFDQSQELAVSAKTSFVVSLGPNAENTDRKR
jgi:acyl dehydratase